MSDDGFSAWDYLMTVLAVVIVFCVLAVALGLALAVVALVLK